MEFCIVWFAVTHFVFYFSLTDFVVVLSKQNVFVATYLGTPPWSSLITVAWNFPQNGATSCYTTFCTLRFSRFYYYVTHNLEGVQRHIQSQVKRLGWIA